MKKLIKVEKQTDNKYLNMYLAYFDDMAAYQFASRSKDISDLDLVNGNINTDAVRILPFYVKDGITYIIMIKEFRYPVGRYIYSIPAGLVENGEDENEAVRRELLEETGYDAIEITHIHRASYISPGMCDETISTYTVLVDHTKQLKQNLDENEEIEVFTLKLSELLDFLENNENIGYQTRLFLETFYYKNELQKYIK